MTTSSALLSTLTLNPCLAPSPCRSLMRDWLPAWVGDVRTQRRSYYYPPTLAILLNMSSLELTMLTLPPVTLTLTGSSTLSPPAVSSSPLSSGSLILFTQPMSVYSLTVNFRAFCR